MLTELQTRLAAAKAGCPPEAAVVRRIEARRTVAIELANNEMLDALLAADVGTVQ